MYSIFVTREDSPATVNSYTFLVLHSHSNQLAFCQLAGRRYETNYVVIKLPKGSEWDIFAKCEQQTLPLTARNARLLATTIAALDERPDPAGTVPVTSRSTGTGCSFDPGAKKWSRTPWTMIRSVDDDQKRGK